jgi:hypothetical protein
MLQMEGLSLFLLTVNTHLNMYIYCMCVLLKGGILSVDVNRHALYMSYMPHKQYVTYIAVMVECLNTQCIS